MKILIDKVLKQYGSEDVVSNHELRNTEVTISSYSEELYNNGGLYVGGKCNGFYVFVDAYVTCVDDEGYPL